MIATQLATAQRWLGAAGFDLGRFGSAGFSDTTGLDHTALARHLGCSEATARQRLFRALAELGECLGPDRV